MIAREISGYNKTEKLKEAVQKEYTRRKRNRKEAKSILSRRAVLLLWIFHELVAARRMRQIKGIENNKSLDREREKRENGRIIIKRYTGSHRDG